MKKLALIGMYAVLSGCAGAQYAIDNYGKVKPVSFRSPSSGSGYRIYDKPEEGRLMITPTIGASFGGGAIKGATLGAVNVLNSEAAYRMAAEEFTKSTGRTCRAESISLVIDPQYEVRYSCEPTAPQSPES